MICGVFIQRIDWNGLTVEVSYEPNWLVSANTRGEPVAHLEVRCIEPEDGALPITETGYRSHFLTASEVQEQGGPIGYVRRWLDEAAQLKDWKDRQDAARQLVLL